MTIFSLWPSPVSSLMRGPTSSMGGMPGQMTRWNHRGNQRNHLIDTRMKWRYEDIWQCTVTVTWDQSNNSFKKQFQLGRVWDGRKTAHSGLKSLFCANQKGERAHLSQIQNFTHFHLQFPLSQRRKRRVLFTQAQVNTFCPLYPIPDTLHRISWYLGPGVLCLWYLRYRTHDTWHLMSRWPDSAWYLLSDMDTANHLLHAFLCGGCVKSICLSSCELEPFSFYLVVIWVLEVKFKSSLGMKIWHFACRELLICHILISELNLITFSSRFPAEGEKESCSLRRR